MTATASDTDIHSKGADADDYANMLEGYGKDEQQQQHQQQQQDTQADIHLPEETASHMMTAIPMMMIFPSYL